MKFFTKRRKNKTLNQSLTSKNKKMLLLKQTLLTTWKNKLQLVILLLLTAFATSLVTGSWISYNRIVDEANNLGIQDTKFDAVLPYNPYSTASENFSQMVEQAFSLSLGKLYYSNESAKSDIALYFDNTRIGKEIDPIKSSDLNIIYSHDSNNKITSLKSISWTNPNHPLNFNFSDPNVAASLYGQLHNKLINTNNPTLKQNYQNNINYLYNKLFLPQVAPKILNSISTYIGNWITTFQNKDPNKILSYKNDVQDNDKFFTQWILEHKINYNANSNDYNPDSSKNNNFAMPADLDVSKTKNWQNLIPFSAKNVPLATANDPKLTYDATDYGMDGQWMSIYRNFDNNTTDINVIANFGGSYSSPYNYGILNDNNGGEQNYSYIVAQAAAALQQHSIFVLNQFVASAFVNANNQTITAKVVDLGSENNLDRINLKVFEGQTVSAQNQVVISPQYARKNHVKPGQFITINKYKFLVVGIGSDAYNFYPIVNSLDPIPNTANQFIVYVDSQAFNNGNWYDINAKTPSSLMYFIPWKNVAVANFNVSYFNDYFQPNIFSINGSNDLNQDSYNQYLVAKYGPTPNPKAQTTYSIQPNLVVTNTNPQFQIYNQGRTIYNSMLNIFKDASLIGVAFLLVIVIFITFLIVKKAIQKNQVSMGILKSMGYKPWRIAVSYLSYPIIALLIAIPIGWIVGLLLQIYFTEIFNSLFSLPYNVFSFNVIPILISIVVIIGFIVISSLLTSFKILKKDTLLLIKKDSDISIGNINTHNSFLAKSFKKNFKLKFWLSLSKTSWKKILTTTGVIGLASLSITATISIPATINAMKYNYFKTQKYRNYYQYQQPISNMPLSKYGLYAWTNLNNENNEPFYPVHGVMPWPDDIIIYGDIHGDNRSEPLAWYNPLQYNFVTKKVKINFYPNVSSDVQAKIIASVNNQLSKQQNGPLTVDLLAWNYTWLGGRAFSNNLLTDLQKLDNSPNKNFSNDLLGFAANLLPGILGVNVPGGVTPGPDAIIDILKQVLPGYIRQLLDAQGPDAYNYFSIGHNTVAYNPTYNKSINGPDEELVTQLKIASNDSNLMSKGFLDVVGINPNTKMIVMNNNLVNGLKYNSSQYKNGVIPMVINQAFAKKYNLSVGQEINAAPNINSLYYLDRNGDYKIIPKNNWYYGTDPAEETNNNKIWDLSANKWNYRGQQEIPKEDGDNLQLYDSFGYDYNGIYNKSGKEAQLNNPKSWNNINDVWLKIPKDISASAYSGTLNDASGKPVDFDLNDNPIVTKQVGNDLWVKPFSLNLINPDPINPVTSLLNRPLEWYAGMLSKGILETQNTLQIGKTSDDVANFPTWWNNLMNNSAPISDGLAKPISKYKIIGVQDSYDTPRAYINQQWANYLLGFSTMKNSVMQNPTYSQEGIQGPYQWFNGKLSSENNIYDLIARLSFKRKSDDYTLYGMTVKNNQQISLIANSDLLSKKEQMLDKMTNIAFGSSAVFIISTLVCSVLIVIMITDLFTDQFRRFMAHMKSEGYSNWEINSFTLGIFTPWVVLGYIVGFLIGITIVYAFIQVISTVTSLVLPFMFIWWILPFSLILIGGIYISTFAINNYELNRMKLVELLSTSE